VIQFSSSGVAIVFLDGYVRMETFNEYTEMFSDLGCTFHNVEFVLNPGESVIEASDYKRHINGFIDVRDFRIENVAWLHLRKVEEPVIIQQGSWYFSISGWHDQHEMEWDGYGPWYSGEMLKVGWFHGGTPEEIDHNKYTMTRRDYAGQR